MNFADIAKRIFSVACRRIGTWTQTLGNSMLNQDTEMF